MNFQLSNDETTASTPSKPHRPVTAADNSRNINDSAFENDEFDPAAENTVFIANQYNHTASAHAAANPSGASYLSQTETFPPILMYFGVALQLLSIIVLIQQIHSDTFISILRTNMESSEMQSFASSLMSVYVLSFLAMISYIVDAAILCHKKMAGGSLVFWAIIFPIVYFFKRCSANRSSSLPALLIIIVLFASSGYASYSCITATVSAMGIEMNETGLNGAAKAYSRASSLSGISISVSGVGEFSYDALIASNITEPVYSYVDATSTTPALFIIKSTTPYGNHENIVINFNYDTMAFHSMTVGNKNYTSFQDIFLYLYKY